jgi:hypothetical protein
MALLLAPGVPTAWADQAADAVAEPPPLSVAGPIPSPPPAVITFADGWTLAVSGSNETQVPVAPEITADQAVGTRDVIVGGSFTGSLRKSGRSAPASGTLEVGYQIDCPSPPGMMAGMIGALKPHVVTVPVTKKEFTGADPQVEVAGFRLQLDGCGTALIRSYAMLTRSAQGSGSVAAYYGVVNVV